MIARGVDVDGRPWTGSLVGERAWRAEVALRVAAWHRRRASLLVLVALAVWSCW